MKSLKLRDDFYWTGIIDDQLRVFDIIMYTEFGTTYNSYVMKAGDKTVLFETAKAKFFDEYLEHLQEVIDIRKIDYLVVSHTEPDHAGSVERLLDYSPQMKVIATGCALGFLKEIVNRDFVGIPARDKEKMTIGNKTLEFLFVPNLHWPDTMYTFIEEEQILVTCDSFGAHYCLPEVVSSEIKNEADYQSALKYYYDCIIGPFKPFMLKALDKIKDLNLKYICPGHGLVLDHTNIEKFVNLYREWCQPTKREKQSIVIPYVTAYGYTEEIAKEIKRGIEASNFDVDILMYNLVTADMNEVLNEINQCSGLLLGSPTLLSDTLPQIWTILSSLNPVIHKGLPASCFGSYGWSGEALKNINERYKQLKFNVVCEPLGIVFRPSEENLKSAYDFGLEFANKVLK